MGKILPVHFHDHTTTTTHFLWQWDTGIDLQIQDLTNLPSAFEVSFSLYPQRGNVYTKMAVLGADDKTVVSVPDVILTGTGEKTDFYIHAYFYTDAYTQYKIVIPVKARTKPEGYAADGEDIYGFQQAITEMSGMVDNAVAAKEEAEAHSHGHANYPDYDEDNAKYWSQQSAIRQNEAQRSAQNAAESEANAEAYAQQTAQDVITATNMKNRAESAAEAAESHASSVSAQAQAAAQSASQANAYKEAAETAVTNAQAQAQAAVQTKTEIDELGRQIAANVELGNSYLVQTQTVAEEAIEAKDEAMIYAGNAADSADNASTSEQNASTYARNANNSAQDAIDFANRSANSATAAATSSADASSHATNAATSASNASASALQASNSASAASTSEQNAASSAAQAKKYYDDLMAEENIVTLLGYEKVQMSLTNDDGSVVTVEVLGKVSSGA